MTQSLNKTLSVNIRGLFTPSFIFFCQRKEA
nr:MAG TPA: hypothetical protein [Caudoviricetes sp.]